MITIDKINNNNIYRFELEGEIDRKGMEQVLNVFQEASDKDQKIRLLGQFGAIPGFEDLKTFVRTMKMKLLARKVIGKYAILSNMTWIRQVLPLGNALFQDITIRHFDEDQKEEAMAWLAA